MIGNGDGTFRQPLLITEPAIRIPQYQPVADYNGDGFQDLALALGYGTDGLMEILNGNGDGTFQPLVLYLKPPAQSSTAASRSSQRISTATANRTSRWGGEERAAAWRR